MGSIDDIESRLAQIEARLAKLEATDDINIPGKNNKHVSIKEYLIDKRPQTANDRALTMGYFLESISGYEAFTAEDIKECFRLAKIPQPKNINDVINKNIAKGYIMESGNSGGKKSWVLTTTGEATVSKGFRSEK